MENNNNLIIEMSKDRVANVDLDIGAIITTFLTENDLKLAISSCMKITYMNDEIFESEDDLLDMIYFNMDWGQIFRNYDGSNMKDFQVSVIKVLIKNQIRYEPYVVDREKGIFELKAITEDNEDYMVVHTAVPMIEHHIEYMLSGNLVDYNNKEFKQYVEFR